MPYRQTPAANSSYILVGAARPGVVTTLRPKTAAVAQAVRVYPQRNEAARKAA